MIVYTTQAQLTQALAPQRGRGESVGFVPTMGALHEGHLSLVRLAREQNASVGVSVFVNPTQFNDPRDLERYPRTPAQDLALLEASGADWVYMPSVGDIYPEPDTREFDFGPLERVMEGAFRPGHFNGVAQVVSRLFEIAQPTKAYFGEKDFQQLAIIRELVRRLDLPVQIVGCPIVREADGLAMSSRNALLTPQCRAAAPAIYRALQEGASLAGKKSVEEVRQAVTAAIDETGVLKTEYFSVVDAATLQEISAWSPAPLRGCVAVQAGAVRLIDNIDMSISE